jgi:plasmid stability protein
MARSITIRNVPDDVVDELSARARRSGRSMQEYLRSELVKAAAQPDINEWLDRVREHGRRVGGADVSTEFILEALHEIRR